MTPDTMFRIASMTKIVTTTAALQLVERGKLDLDAPVDQYLPEFADLQVLEGFDGDEPRLRAPATQATVRHLVTHTSGLAYWFFNADIVRWEEATGTPNVLSGSNAIFAAPLVADPGTQYEYGINTDWLGRVVEAASGQSLDAYFAEHILGPLGMDPDDVPDERGAARELGAGAPARRGRRVAGDRRRLVPGAGVVGRRPRAALDAARLPAASSACCWAAGRSTARRSSSAATVEDVFTNQIGDARLPAEIATADPGSTADFNAGPGFKWGLGLLLNSEQQPGMRAAGSGAWAGIFNTHFWVDPASGVTGAIYAQTLPFVEPAVFQVYIDFEQALYASIGAGSVRSRRFERVPEEATQKAT